jgi:Domain of unknown function (DUF4148)
MNASKTISVICSAVLAIGLCSASAAEEANNAPAPELTRAEVLADLAIWRESGLADAQSGESAADPVSPTYIAAMARYQALRASPQFALLVQRIARERGEKAQIAAQR